MKINYLNQDVAISEDFKCNENIDYETLDIGEVHRSYDCCCSYK